MMGFICQESSSGGNKALLASWRNILGVRIRRENTEEVNGYNIADFGGGSIW